MQTAYCDSLAEYIRVETSEVQIGNIPLGGSQPIRLQSMTNTSTSDVKATVEQSIKIIDAGGHYVRITAPGVKDAEILKDVKAELLARGYDNPIVADIHYNPRAAVIAAEYVEKVRINPGNYVDKKKFEHLEYTDAEYLQELERIHENLLPLLHACKEHGTAIRIGVNHGSLSDRIMSRYGDTPRGMVVSLLEFLEICRNEDFHDIVLSIKASNTVIMVQACRMIVAEMKKMGRVYPLHLGVTEAGEGEDGRIKSAVGIGTLLADGIGDTVRVSLTEDPEAEIPVARALVDYCSRPQLAPAFSVPDIGFDPFTYKKRETDTVGTLIGGSNKAVVIADCRNKKADCMPMGAKPDFALVDEFQENIAVSVGQIIPAKKWNGSQGQYPLFRYDEVDIEQCSDQLNFIEVPCSGIGKIAELVNKLPSAFAILLVPETDAPMREIRAAFFQLIAQDINAPAVPVFNYPDSDLNALQLKAAADAGALLLDGFADGLAISADQIPVENTIAASFAILQASRVRFSKTEYISCPSCGRTMFNLQDTAKRIREKTNHLTGLKIGIMGCVVNGPGEMADADYGYVGAGPGKVNLYKQKNVVLKNVPSADAVDQLIGLIKENGDWTDPE